ncbi:MAG TPA: hypothetical protein VFI61_00100 [Patescibacteria group bacterium]|nr:hypothetical protein [Patescibacteria group bacterium]
MAEGKDFDNFLNGGEDGELFGEGETQNTPKRPPKIESQEFKNSEPVEPSVTGRNIPLPVEEDRDVSFIVPTPDVAEPESETNTPGQKETEIGTETKSEEKTSISSTAKTVADAALGAALIKTGEKVINQTGKSVREKLWGNRGPQGKDIKNEDDAKEALLYFDVQEEAIRHSIGNRSFMSLQNELKRYILKPNEKEELDLKRDRMKPLRVADTEDKGGIGVITTIKNHIAKIRTGMNFGEAKEAIQKINVVGLENEASTLFGWDPKLEGIIQAYKDTTLKNMDLAEEVAKNGPNTAKAKALQREIDVIGWGGVPVDQVNWAREYFESLKAVKSGTKTGGGGLGGFSPEDYAKAMGQPTAEQQKELYLKAEENQTAIPMELTVPSFLLPEDPYLREKVQSEWKARAKLSSATAFKKTAPSVDKIFPNQDEIDITKEDLKALLSKEGVIQSLSAYINIIAENKDLNILLPDASRGEKFESFFWINNLEGLHNFRENMRGWLENNFALDSLEARDAEQIAWNLTYLSDIVEDCDSTYNRKLIVKPKPKDKESEKKSFTDKLKKRFNNLKESFPMKKEETKRMPPVPQIKSLAVWMMMHPQERLKGKINANEAWGQFGEWALKRKRSVTSGFKVPEVLPKSLVVSVFKEIDVKGKGKMSTSLYDVLVKTGEDILNEPTSFDNYLTTSSTPFVGEDINWENVGIDWEGTVSEGPFGGYLFDKTSSAVKIFGLIQNGEWKGTLSDLANNCRKLKLKKYDRENLLKAIQGIDTRSSKLKAKGFDAIDWIFYLNGVKKYSPNFFK